LDIHGVKRDFTWSLLHETVEAGVTTIHVKDIVDW
jgi:hypothetical protein